MTRLTLLITLTGLCTACIRPRQLDPPGLAVGAFRVEQDTAPNTHRIRGVGVILQPGRMRIGLIQEVVIELRHDTPAHIRGRTFEAWPLPCSSHQPLPQESTDD
ncbi:MAG: hypothetical protein AAGC44_15715 [Planctomycetota bacterium]